VGVSEKARQKRQGDPQGSAADDERGREPLRKPLAGPDLSLASWQDGDRLFRVLRENLVRVDQPLALISQTQRSGGTLINSLLDGHPQLHVHPFELHIGNPTKYDWPVLELDASPDAWLDTLREPFIARFFVEGYRKWPDIGVLRAQPRMPFTLAPSFLERLFRLLCADKPPATRREILDSYLTAFFNAWADCQGLRDGLKKWTVGFAPRLAWGESGRRFADDYPDGRVIASHRDPRAWYASASRFSSRYGELDQALELWARGAREIIDAKRANPKRVFVLTYEGLVTQPKRTMRSLADWLGIRWDPVLLKPTFNRQPTIPNSSYELRSTGIRKEPLTRWESVLSAEALDRIGAELMDIDAAVRELADA